MYRGRPIAGIINEVFSAKARPVWGVVASDDGIDKAVLRGRKESKPAEGAAANIVTISRSHTGTGQVC